ncbi:MAG TPA: tetratricopeptide repeat protein, partial [bacterium]|nr:tetratricopeptide repeat protein [bacterium]
RTSWRGTAATRARRIAISLAGPFSGICFGALVLVAAPATIGVPLLASVRADLLWINLGWGVLNLLPILPLDGGHVTAALFGDRAATIISRVAAGALALAALAFGWGAAAFLLVWILASSFRTRREAPHEWFLRQASEAAGREDWQMAEKAFREALARAPDADTRTRIVVALVQTLLRAGRRDDALATVDLLPPETRGREAFRGAVLVAIGRAPEAIAALEAAWAKAPDAETGAALVRALLAGDLLSRAEAFVRTPDAPLDATAFAPVVAKVFAAGRFDDAATLAEQAFARTHDPQLAYNAACSHSRAGRAEEALAWIVRALDAGWRDAAFLENDADLALARALPGFDALRGRLQALRAAP